MLCRRCNMGMNAQRMLQQPRPCQVRQSWKHTCSAGRVLWSVPKHKSRQARAMLLLLCIHNALLQAACYQPVQAGQSMAKSYSATNLNSLKAPPASCKTYELHHAIMKTGGGYVLQHLLVPQQGLWSHPKGQAQRLQCPLQTLCAIKCTSSIP